MGAVLTGAVLGAVAGGLARVLLGRLRRGARVRTPVCEAVVGVAWAGIGAGWAAGVWTPPWVVLLLALTWFAAAAGVVDLRHRRLPDALTLPAVPAALLLVAPLGPTALGRAAVGAVLACGVHAAVHLASPRSLGAGDVKLSASLGAVLAAVSWGALPLAAVLASLLTIVAAVRPRAVVAAAVTGGLPGRPRAPVPHGPSMLLAASAVVAAGALRW
ncbi:prepilin peptidase [Pseudonocardia oceani]|uniref:Prepilin peptidase n=1 Tax=Pseudonocardia oceani TaxID=2792013 RepID=A0ABS6UK52_9PSEU|nr:A24 family peptidase [Pseudonocardia oceani]MBW0132253.1 prepilin peptidase [Pseudonocardia oceani]